ncbi:hypothetical protein KMW28_26990 [Flammeovirga yaeyamensis]|uniref:Uncharacterized protein n=1 Tax=Flammeovirga yaeyamensis TaxID=367791 RepID=A0AAX1NAJ3_9BACT|nr:hypothetical protein [Flammeovirga yaeyamensis]MBB3700077.1 hypothetical protein [Flammeovirga yaeyamensis]NMF37489.1 hypothetical protein [Flammeovirga yaeyamensis]QWG04546.1 hypothetical protein KMW28_26990 [Flammeovirga yaeyamensis]
MTRRDLIPLKGQRLTFTATVGRMGTKSAFKGPPLPTVLLKNLSIKSDVVANHLWMNVGKQFMDLRLQPGDVIQFDARVTEYVKGYKGHRSDVHKPLEQDYKLERPTKIAKL